MKTPKNNEQLPFDNITSTVNGLTPIAPAPDLPSEYFILAQSKSSNALARKLTSRINEMQLDFFGHANIEDLDFKLTIKGYAELQNGVNVSALKLLDILVMKSTETGLANTYVQLSLKEFMEIRGLRDEKEARKQVKRDLEALSRVSFDWKGFGRQKNTWFNVSLYGGTKGIINGVIHFRFNEDFYQSLRVNETKYLFMYFPREAFKLADNHHPYSYYLARKLSEHKRMNLGKPNEDIISVETLLSACVNMPKYEELGEARQVSLRIREPFERDMDELSSSILWEYVEDDIKSWSEFIKAHIHVIWLRYPENKTPLPVRK